mgnify:FL=1
MFSQSKKPSNTGNLGVRETAAASLLVIGRLALAEFCVRRGYAPALLARMHDEAVSAWVDAWGCDCVLVEEAVSNMHANVCGTPDSSDAVRYTMLTSTCVESTTNH